MMGLGASKEEGVGHAGLEHKQDYLWSSAARNAGRGAKSRRI